MVVGAGSEMSLPSYAGMESLGETDLSEALVLLSGLPWSLSCLRPPSSESFFKGLPARWEAPGPEAAVVLILVAPRQSDPGRGLQKMSRFLNPQAQKVA